MRLIVVESPKKCDTIGRYLGSDYKVMASQGHIRDLSTKGKGGLGIDCEKGFTPDFVISTNKKKIVSELSKAAKSAEEVILATDPDREGEAIAWHLAQVLKLDVDKTKRLQFHEITKPAILAAIADPKKIDLNLVNSQETRRMYDRIIGFKLSSLLQKKMHSKSAGRVQSVTLKMICNNDAEVKAFVPEEYWTIEAELLIDGKPLKVALDKVDGKALTIKNKDEAEAIMKRIGEEMNLTSLVTNEKSVSSKLPFKTSTMQQEASTRYKFSLDKTQKLAQRLYEGLDIAGEHVGLITYIRTDSTRLSPAWYENHAKPFIIETFGSEYIGSLKAAKNGVLSQDAHEAIRPTGTHRTPELVAKYVGKDEAKLYRLIYDRALASVMSDKQVAESTAIFETGGLTFKATGSRTLFKGFEAIYGEFDEPDAKALPELKEGENYHLSDKKDEQKFTKGPARYSEAKIVKLMEEEGIGRPSTYATTIKTLQNRGYIVVENGVLVPTETGLRTTLVLEKYFPEIVSTEYTAKMENTLDEIEKGEETKIEAMNDFYGPFMENFQKVQEVMYKDPLTETGDICPKCGSPLVLRKSRYGTFAACSNYPKCDYIKKPEKTPAKETGEKCPQCGKPLVYRTDRKGKEFVACSGFPKCRYIQGAENAQRVVPTYTEADYVKDCPSCKGGHLVIKKGKKVSFLGCTNFPKCHYHEWLTDTKKKDA